jgi:drug/metabolite transporter (DMT)-like permease
MDAPTDISRKPTRLPPRILLPNRPRPSRRREVILQLKLVVLAIACGAAVALLSYVASEGTSAHTTVATVVSDQ